jgi:hypothetical protein
MEGGGEEGKKENCRTVMGMSFSSGPVNVH